MQNITVQGQFLPEAFFSGGGAVRIEAQDDGSGKAILDDRASLGGLVIKSVITRARSTCRPTAPGVRW